MKILIINGPNLNRLGKRDKEYYGNLTLKKIQTLLKTEAKKVSCQLQFFQSNYEGALVDFLQNESDSADGILINPGALTHYGYSLYDALLDTHLPIVEVHLSDIKSRKELWRQQSVIQPLTIAQFAGEKEQSYLAGFKFLINHLQQGQ